MDLIQVVVVLIVIGVLLMLVNRYGGEWIAAPMLKIINAVVDDPAALPGEAALPALEPPRDNQKLQTARQLAKDNPAAVANIMREWVSGEAAA